MLNARGRFSQDFDDESPPAPPALWYDQMGAWEIQVDPYDDSDDSSSSSSSSRTAAAKTNNTSKKKDARNKGKGSSGSGVINHVMRQVSPVWPAC